MIRVIWLRHIKIVSDGSIHEIFNEKSSIYTFIDILRISS